MALSSLTLSPIQLIPILLMIRCYICNQLFQLIQTIFHAPRIQPHIIFIYMTTILLFLNLSMEYVLLVAAWFKTIQALGPFLSVVFLIVYVTHSILFFCLMDLIRSPADFVESALYGTLIQLFIFLYSTEDLSSILYVMLIQLGETCALAFVVLFSSFTLF